MVTMLLNDLGPLFPLGKVTLTPGVKRSLSGRDLLDAIMGHMRGQRCAFTRDGDQFHFLFAMEGCRVLGNYHARNGRRVLIVTEADRSCTTVMLAEEFSNRATC